MLKKTLIASSLTLGLMMATQGVQANPVSNLLSGFISDASSIQFDARRGGARRSASSRRSSTSSSRAVTTNRANTTQQRKDAEFSPNARTTNNNVNQRTPVNNPNAAPTPQMQQGNLGMGGSFLSSLAGAGAGVLLANMLLSPSAAAAAGTEVATPDMLSDDQIKECLSQIDTDIKDAEQRLQDAAPEDQTAIRDEISQMNNLKIALMQEQLNRLQKAS